MSLFYEHEDMEFFKNIAKNPPKKNTQISEHTARLLSNAHVIYVAKKMNN
jgi:hypothetical protein